MESGQHDTPTIWAGCNAMNSETQLFTLCKVTSYSERVHMSSPSCTEIVQAGSYILESDFVKQISSFNN